MWSYMIFLLIIGSVVADHHYAWETGNEYHFLIRSRTLTVLDNLANQFSGILMKGDLTVQVKSSDTLQAVISKAQYAPVHKVLPKGWDSEVTDLEFDELSLSEKPFEIKLEHGVIRDVLVDQEVPTWEVNLLKSIVSQLQIDIQGKNMIENEYQVPSDNEPFGQFKAIEDSVGGKCEVHYHIEQLSEHVLLKTPELVPLPDLRKDGRHLVITKDKYYNKCEQQMAYYSGIVDKMNWKSNNELSKSSTSRIVISGIPSRFTIQSSVTTNKISISSKIHDTYSGAVYSRINLTLSRISKISNSMPESKNSVSTGNLVYTYNKLFSSQREPLRPSRRSSASESRSSNSSSEENRDNNDNNDSSSNSSEERDYLQPKPKLDEAPEIPLLPYFIGYKGKSIQKSENNFSLVATQLVAWITKKIENFPSDVLEKPHLEIFEQHISLVRLIRTMNVRQISELENVVRQFYLNSNHDNFTPEGWELYKQTAQDVLHGAVAHAGTGPALITIKNWIRRKDLQGKSAAQIIAQIPKAALTPTAEYIQAFFELITDEQVKKERFLNTTAPLSFAELVRYTQRNKSYYPVNGFDRTISKRDSALLQTYISYMATQLREAIQDGDSLRIQTYIMALGNFGHSKILSVFEPYLEGTLPISKFQRLMMVISLNRLVENFPRVARSVAYKIYMNLMEAYELRCAAVYIIMNANPSLNMLKRMAEFTNEDQDNQVNSAVKTSIDALANLKQSSNMQDLASKASIARELLNPHIYIENYSRGYLQEEIIAFLNIAQTTILQTIGSDDFGISKGAYLNIHQSYGNFNLPTARMSYSISNIRELLDMWYQMPWMIENEKKLIIEETIEKLGIKAEDPEQIEGNVFADTLFSSEFSPFDNCTLDEIGKTLMQHVALILHLKTPQVLKRNMNYVYYYDVTMAVPTESGLPFIYTLTIPKLTRVSGEGHYLMNNSSTGKLTAAGHIIASEKIQSRIGFVAPFEHKHYIAGIDTNTQYFIPAGLSVKYQGKKKFELNMLPDEYYKYGTGHSMIHHSVVPYTARHDILSFEHLPNETRLVNTKEPHKIEFSIGGSIFVAKSDNIDIEASKKEGIEAFGEIYNVFRNSGAHYRTFDAVFYLMAAQVNISFDTYMYSNSSDPEIPAIPATIDKRPDSEERKIQFLKEVSKDVNFATSYICDISVLTEMNQQVYTVAVTNSHLDNKLQALFYYNMQSPDDENDLFEFCAIGYIQSSPNIPLNFGKAIEEIPKTEFKAEMRFRSCANGDAIRLKGNWTSSDDAKEMAIKSETTEKCRQEVKQGNIWLPNCQKASKLVRQKNHLMMSIDMEDSIDTYIIANGIIEQYKTYICKVNVMPNSENANRKIIDVEIKINNDTEISLGFLEMNVSMCPINTFKENLALWKKNLEEASEEFVCVLDKTQVATFDNKIYPLKLGNCWHVVMTTYPKRDPNNPEKTLKIPKYSKMIVMAREMDDGSKQIRMLLGDQEIHLQKSDNLEVVVNNQVANFWHGSHHGDTFEIYQLDGMIVIYSFEYEIYAVYDGERILIRPSSKYFKSVRGLCGNYDKRSDNDFIIPKNCILTKPEEFAATYALTQENCQGPALQNKRKAEESTCIARSYRPSDVISDREAGKAPTKNRRQGSH